MIETASVVIPCRVRGDDLHLDKSRHRKSKDRGGRMSSLWCASGQRSPTSSYDAAMPYDIPHLVRPTLRGNNDDNSSSVVTQPNGVNLRIQSAPSNDSGVDCNSSVGSEKEVLPAPCPRHLPPTGSVRPSSSSALKISQRNPSIDGAKTYIPEADVDCRGSNPTSVIPKSRMLRSWSSFSLRTFTLRRKESPLTRPPATVKPEASTNDTGNRMEQSRKRVGGSMPGDDRLNLSSNRVAEDEIVRKRTHTQVAERLSRLSRSFRRRRSSDRVASDLKNTELSSESSSTSSTSSSSSSAHQAIILYGTASRRRSSFKLSLSLSDSNGTPPFTEKSGRKSGCDLTPSCQSVPLPLSLPDGVQLVKILKFDHYMTNKWVSGMAINDKNELVLVDLREAYLVDELGNLIRTIGSKGSDRLIEPIGVSAGPEGRLIFTDHAELNVKVFTNRGNHLRTVTDFSLSNIAGVACNRATGEIFVAGTDRKRVFVHVDGETRRIPSDRNCTGSQAFFKHPFSVAYNLITRELIVGDDYAQSVMAVSMEGKLMWRFCPPTHEGERQFFPSSVCVDHVGNVFVADLYNGKVCMLDSKGQFVRTLLSRDCGLSGNPGAIATDGKGRIYVSDEERTVKVFQYESTC